MDLLFHPNYGINIPGFPGKVHKKLRYFCIKVYQKYRFVSVVAANLDLFDYFIRFLLTCTPLF